MRIVSVAQWMECPPSVRKAAGSILVVGSKFFFFFVLLALKRMETEIRLYSYNT